MSVTEENKHDYVRLVANMKLTEAIREQIDSFRAGFYELVRQSDISIFNEQVGLFSFALFFLFPFSQIHCFVPDHFSGA